MNEKNIIEIIQCYKKESVFEFLQKILQILKKYAMITIR